VGDTGTLEGGGSSYAVVDTQRSGDLIVHVLDGACGFRPGDEVRMRVDGRRRSETAANHTATHLVHEALRRVLGSQLHQQGSLVAPDRLRFDFNHHEKITHDQLRAIEDIVNEKIALRVPVHALNDPKEWLTIEEAKRRYPNVKMFFGEKYGHRVRIVEIDPAFSVELCGGTHTAHTAELGSFKIVSESGISSGVRRIEAVTGDGFRAYLESVVAESGALDRQIEQLIREQEELIRQVGATAHRAPGAVAAPIDAGRGSVESLERIEKGRRERREEADRLSREVLSLKKELGKKLVDHAASGLDAILGKAVTSGGIRVVADRVDAPDMEALKSLGDRLRERLGSGVGVLGTVIGDKVAFVCVVTDDIVSGKKLSAGRIVGAVAKIAGGGGGGRDHLATAGGKDPAKLDEALAAVPGVIASIGTEGRPNDNR
jgi:alanyl-tRNA synthetase